MKFQVYKDEAGKLRFRLIAKNGEIIASSEAYESKAAALKGIRAVKRCGKAKVEDTTKAETK